MKAYTNPGQGSHRKGGPGDGMGELMFVLVIAGALLGCALCFVGTRTPSQKPQKMKCWTRSLSLVSKYIFSFGRANHI